MSLVPVKGNWAYQLGSGENASFVVETLALANVKAIYQPILRCYNSNTEAIDLKIVHNLNMGTVGSSNPLASMSFSLAVVDESVPGGTFRDYDFGGIQLDNDTDIRSTHTVTLTNNGTSTNVIQVIIFGMAEVETQLPAGQEIIRI